jgi:GNAT superfamily N-acetyltransferase
VRLPFSAHPPARGTSRTPAGIEIRPLAPGDVDAVASTLRHRVVVADRLDRQRRGECLYAIAWEGSRPQGQALLHWQRPTALAVRPDLDALPYLEDLFVLPSGRRRGIGTALLDACLAAAQARGRPAITLAVNVENHAARRLYDRLGYRRPGTPPRRQPTSEHMLDGSLRIAEETVIDLVRSVDDSRLDGAGAQADAGTDGVAGSPGGGDR